MEAPKKPNPESERTSLAPEICERGSIHLTLKGGLGSRFRNTVNIGFEYSSSLNVLPSCVSPENELRSENSWLSNFPELNESTGRCAMAASERMRKVRGRLFRIEPRFERNFSAGRLEKTILNKHT